MAVKDSINKFDRKAYIKEWQSKHGKESYKRNRSKILEYKKRYYKENREEILRKQKLQLQTEKGKARKHENRKNERPQHKLREKNRKLRFYAWWKEYKKTLSCNRCPESHVACLDFHHIDPQDKEYTINKLIHKTASRERVLKEVKKCEVLCANCHRKEHTKEDDNASSY